MVNYLEIHDLLSKEQFGFRPGLSTVDAIATSLDDTGTNVSKII